MSRVLALAHRSPLSVSGGGAQLSIVCQDHRGVETGVRRVDCAGAVCTGRLALINWSQWPGVRPARSGGSWCQPALPGTRSSRDSAMGEQSRPVPLVRRGARGRIANCTIMQIIISLTVFVSRHIIFMIFLCPSVRAEADHEQAGRTPGSMAPRPQWPEASLSSGGQVMISSLCTQLRCRALIGQLACSQSSDWLLRTL